MDIDPISIIDLLTILVAATVTITLILSIAAVVLLRPLSHRLGLLLEAMAREKNMLRDGADAGRLRELVEAVESRVSLLEDRQDFERAMRTDPAERGRLPERTVSSPGEGS